MSGLIFASLFFLIIHLIIAGTTIRDLIVTAIGERPYLAVFSVVSLGGIVWLVMAYNQAVLETQNVFWDLGVGVRHMGSPVMFLSAMLVVPGLLTPNPTTVGMEGLASRPDAAKGMLRVTRHPFLWGVALWAGFHLAANGDEASVWFFGTFLLLSIAGTFSIDAKRRRKMNEAWEPFARQTSNIPFAAILAGRSRFVLSELLTFRQLAGVIVFLSLLFLHHWAFKASPFPGGWVPF